MSCSEHSRRRVAYYYDSNVGNFYYGQGHVMKPNRIRMTHHLLINYGVYRFLEVYRPYPASFEDMCRFHSQDYIEFLKSANPDNIKQHNKQMLKFNVGEDCPVFDGLYEFCQLSSGGTLAAAVKLNKQKSDIVINWMGGLHHAKKAEASGFCYTNDIVLGILELLKYHKRVLYVDIDVHHGDGVEEAFYTTDRVMTVSFHKFGDFFPGTGDLKDIGAGRGRYYSVNIPLKDGVTDESFQSIYKPVMRKVMEMFQPNVVVLQCGADSLYGDRLGTFNLTLHGHGDCVKFLREYNVPLMLLGGGGYTPRNVARCWTHETAIAVDKEIPDEIPYNDYFEYFAPNYRLQFEGGTMSNENGPEYLRTIEEGVVENLRKLPPTPSVQFHPIARDSIRIDDTSLGVDISDPDKRLPQAINDIIVQHSGEFYETENESDDRRHHQSYQKRPAIASELESKDSTSEDRHKRQKMEIGGNTNSNGAITDEIPVSKMSINDST